MFAVLFSFQRTNRSKRLHYISMHCFIMSSAFLRCLPEKRSNRFSGSGRLISGEYDNITKPCAVQAILESLMSQDMSDGTHRHTFPLLNIQHSTFHRHSSVPVTADQSTMHTTQGDVKVVQKRTFCRRKKILNICNLSYIPT